MIHDEALSDGIALLLDRSDRCRMGRDILSKGTLTSLLRFSWRRTELRDAYAGRRSRPRSASLVFEFRSFVVVEQPVVKYPLDKVLSILLV